MMTRDEIAWKRDLEDELADVKRRMRQLTDGEEDGHKWHELGLTKSEMRVLRVLLIRDLATNEALLAAVYWDKPDEGSLDTVKVFICKVKQKLPFLKPWLRCVSGLGYSLHAEGKHRLLFELKNPGLTRQEAKNENGWREEQGQFVREGGL